MQYEVCNEARTIFIEYLYEELDRRSQEINEKYKGYKDNPIILHGLDTKEEGKLEEWLDSRLEKIQKKSDEETIATEAVLAFKQNILSEFRKRVAEITKKYEGCKYTAVDGSPKQKSIEELDIWFIEELKKVPR